MLVVVSHEATAQYDSLYIESYKGYLMGRLLINRKTTGMRFYHQRDGYTLRYQPNKTFNAGLGITYKFVTLKVSTGIHQPIDTRGRTRDLDVQFHSYGRKYTIDFLAQFYKGFYLPDQRFALAGKDYYVRPDLAVSALGTSFQYVLNHRKFSYRAAFQQTEWQKKSAGTFLVGLELFMGRFRGDSTIVPAELQERNSAESLRKMRFLELGPNAGYSYTWVYKKFFINAGAALSLNVGVNRFIDASGGQTYVGLSPNTVVRVSMGYNVRQWGVNLLYLSTALHIPDFESRSVVVNTGTLRFNLVYRIVPAKKVKRYLKLIDKVDERLHD
jgi:hypothetical protein